MNRQDLFELIRRKRSFLCVGLDTDPAKIPNCLHNEANPVLAFNAAIITATAPYAVAYKPNTAFYEAQGDQGWHNLIRTAEMIPDDLFSIADAKRGDIGNTSDAYARAFFEQMNFDAVTVAPYMGRDSVQPFLSHPGKWAIVLALTSNTGSDDFQLQPSASGQLYAEVLTKVSAWGTIDNLMFVTGATKTEYLAKIRAIVPEHFLLVPGVGAQGGDLEAVTQAAFNSQCGILVNASRSIIYASSGPDFAEAAATEAAMLQEQMAALLGQAGLLDS